MAVRLILGLSAPVRVLIALGTIAGGGLALWKATQEVAEAELLGPPAWWVMIRHRIKPDPPPASDPKNIHQYRVASRVFRWNRDRWEPMTPHFYAEKVTTVAGYLAGGVPDGRAVSAQVIWSRAGAAWRQIAVAYGKDVVPKLPR